MTPRSSPCRPSRLGRRDTSTGHRLRVVERPYTPYLRWELQFLRLRAEAGERLRVLDSGALGDGRDLHRLLELVILGSSVMYRVLYDGSGTLSAAPGRPSTQT
ncbi:DUF6879 family protein [Streptosporangium sandarakinum]